MNCVCIGDFPLHLLWHLVCIFFILTEAGWNRLAVVN